MLKIRDITIFVIKKNWGQEYFFLKIYIYMYAYTRTCVSFMIIPIYFNNGNVQFGFIMRRVYINCCL